MGMGRQLSQVICNIREEQSIRGHRSSPLSQKHHPSTYRCCCVMHTDYFISSPHSLATVRTPLIRPTGDCVATGSHAVPNIYIYIYSIKYIEPTAWRRSMLQKNRTASPLACMEKKKGEGKSRR